MSDQPRTREQLGREVCERVGVVTAHHQEALARLLWADPATSTHDAQVVLHDLLCDRSGGAVHHALGRLAQLQQREAESALLIELNAGNLGQLLRVELE